MTVEEFVKLQGGVHTVCEMTGFSRQSVQFWMKANRMPVAVGVRLGLKMKKAPPYKTNAAIASMPSIEVVAVEVPAEAPVVQEQAELPLTQHHDLAAPPPLQDHRFGEMIKGEHYAYARGLTINPIHLPVALDAMLVDGWELMAVFGDTQSDRVGFVFKRINGGK